MRNISSLAPSNFGPTEERIVTTDNLSGFCSESINSILKEASES